MMSLPSDLQSPSAFLRLIYATPMRGQWVCLTSQEVRNENMLRNTNGCKVL